jgi:hypothetical protein
VLIGPAGAIKPVAPFALLLERFLLPFVTLRSGINNHCHDRRSLEHPDTNQWVISEREIKQKKKE